MAYVLEIGQFGVVKRPYSYMRLAQATSHQMQWKQVAICDEIQPLKDLAERMARREFDYRITGVGDHCLFKTLIVKPESLSTTEPQNSISEATGEQG